ncbi:grasp-with-spasm system SPASM domain peptide maturase [Yeosuana sp.]|uniref:grasp-with-spasm system SPASM domain peptide maturase n=1 Tax=Yeosuana sp. TaxID=2529388 RepID=UPI004054F356
MKKIDLFSFKNKFLHFHADCIPVKGKKNMALYDLTRNSVHFFPSSYFEIINHLKKHRLGEFMEMIDSSKDFDQFFEFVDFALNNELAFFIDDTSLFPDIEKKWSSPSKIQNSIIDISDIKHDFKNIFNQLDDLGCQFIQLRFYSNIYSYDEINDIIQHAYHKSIISLDILMKFDHSWKNNNYYNNLIENHPIISSLIVHSSDKRFKEDTSWGYEGELKSLVTKSISFTEQVIDSCEHCGIINKKYLTLSGVGGYMENALFNGCLNKKVSIDINGSIKNCPSMQKEYGYIGQNTIESIIKKKEFQKWWFINKDKISECKDCELRYMCTDCRAYLKDSSNPFSKPKKCDYNPNTGNWE